MRISTKRVEEFKAEIMREFFEAEKEASEMVDNPAIIRVGCVDPLTVDGQWHPPGGGLFLFLEGYLVSWYETRVSAGVTEGVFYVHQYCGYLFSAYDYYLVEQHKIIIEAFKDIVSMLNAEYNVGFKVVEEFNGSAKKFMQPD